MGRPRPARPPVDRARGSGRPDRRSRTGILGDMSVGDGLREGVGGTIAAMKALGLDVGAYRLSLYSLFSTVIVAIFLYIAVRSEEHTSELQSLMRTSYAVFCLQKKNNQLTQYNNLSDIIK